jgi:small subunit ribosomal protein S7
MSRKGQARIRDIAPDPKFHDRTVTKFVNVVMERGKKAVAEQILYGALDLVADRTKEDGLVVFKRALDNVRPAVEVRSRRVGGANYQVPVEVRPLRRSSLAMRWLGPCARRKIDARSAGERNSGGGGKPGWGGQKTRRYSSDGGGQSRLRSLPLVSK